MKWNNANMPSNDEPRKHEMKEYKPCPVKMNQWSMKLNNTNRTQQVRTSESRSETLQTMPNNEEPVKHEVKQYKTVAVIMNLWSRKRNNANHAH